MPFCNPFSHCFRGSKKEPEVLTESEKLLAGPALSKEDKKTAARLEKEEAASQAYISRHVKRCPHCNVGIQRYGGCSKQFCICGKIFCYNCISPWTEHATTCDMHPQYYIDLKRNGEKLK
ncbi:hypothetical protein ACEPPN_010829 [Leptodophora sp. 'Broadleaf-Isolate-01']